MREVGEAGLRTALAAYADDEARVVVAGNHATPSALLRVLDAALPRYRLVMLNAQEGVPDRDGVVHETPFVGPGVRDSPRLVYLPARLSLVPAMLASSLVPDIVLLHTTPPRDGEVSLGIEVNILPAAIERVRRRGGLVITQLNEHMPWTCGDSVVSTALIDLAFEAAQPLSVPGAVHPNPAEAPIADRVARLVVDGATLQAGIGAVPDAVLTSLRHHRRLRIWTEIFSDGVLHLERAGALERDRPLITSFLYGGAELLDWVRDNPRVQMRRTETVNNPARIARQRRMTSLNTALQVDTFGQANASWIRGRVYSGLGGQSDFVVGALHSRDGLAILALPSWHPKAQRSTIVSRLDGPVSSFQHSWVVSEYGAAALWPQSQRAQARQLIDDVAHPAAREQLLEQAYATGALGNAALGS